MSDEYKPAGRSAEEREAALQEIFAEERERRGLDTVRESGSKSITEKFGIVFDRAKDRVRDILGIQTEQPSGHDSVSESPGTDA